MKDTSWKFLGHSELPSVWERLALEPQCLYSVLYPFCAHFTGCLRATFVWRSGFADDGTCCDHCLRMWFAVLRGPVDLPCAPPHLLTPWRRIMVQLSISIFWEVALVLWGPVALPCAFPHLLTS